MREELALSAFPGLLVNSSGKDIVRRQYMYSENPNQRVTSIGKPDVVRILKGTLLEAV
jgi:hypothetical protein